MQFSDDFRCGGGTPINVTCKYFIRKIFPNIFPVVIDASVLKERKKNIIQREHEMAAVLSYKEKDWERKKFAIISKIRAQSRSFFTVQCVTAVMAALCGTCASPLILRKPPSHKTVS